MFDYNLMVDLLNPSLGPRLFLFESESKSKSS